MDFYYNLEATPSECAKVLFNLLNILRDEAEELERDLANLQDSILECIVDDKKPDVTEVHDYCHTKGELRVLESLSSALKVMEKHGGEYL